jgi:creatinine amidohydrolase/Fe(II)-dependent formamide hydrolase-like protein
VAGQHTLARHSGQHTRSDRSDRPVIEVIQQGIRPILTHQTVCINEGDERLATLDHSHVARAGDARPLAEILPELMRSGVREVSASGVLGDPTGANADAGKALFEAMVQVVLSQAVGAARAP